MLRIQLAAPRLCPGRLLSWRAEALCLHSGRRSPTAKNLHHSASQHTSLLIRRSVDVGPGQWPFQSDITERQMVTRVLSFLQEATPGQVDHHDGDVVAAALVDGSAGQNGGSNACGGLTAGAALLRPPQASLCQRTRLLCQTRSDSNL